MPTILDPGFYQKVVNALLLRGEQVDFRTFPEGPILLTLDFTQFLTSPPPLPSGGTPGRSKGTFRWFNPGAPLGTDFVLAPATLTDQNGITGFLKAGARWQVLALSAILTTSAVAGTRSPGLIWQSSVVGNNSQWLGQTATGVLASTVTTFSWGFGLAAAGLGQINSVSVLQVIPTIPSLYLEAGWQLRSLTPGLLGGDQWSSIWMYVEEF